MSITIEQRDGVDHVVHSDLNGWARPATPDESALWSAKDARIAELDSELDTMNVAVGYFHEENDRFITRIAELEKALRWHVGVQHDRYCDINEGKSNCDCGHNLVRPSP